MPFEKGHKKQGGRITGVSINERTRRLREAGINGIEDLKYLAIENLKNFAEGTDKTFKFLASKELAKYNFPQKRETDLKASGVINIITNPKITGDA